MNLEKLGPKTKKKSQALALVSFNKISCQNKNNDRMEKWLGLGVTVKVSFRLEDQGRMR